MPPETLLLFSDTYPYGTGETFLHEEIPFLAKRFERIIIVPLYHPGGWEPDTERNICDPGRARKQQLPPNVYVQPPLLPFDHKNRKRLLINGLFRYTFSGTFHYGPLFPLLLKEWKNAFKKKIPFTKRNIWIFFNYFLLIRSILAQNCTMKRMEHLFAISSLAYFYWGDKSILIAPALKRKQRKKGRKFPQLVARFHGSDLYEEAKGYLPFREQIYPALDYAFPVSGHGAEYIRHRYPHTQPRHIEVFHLGSSLPEGTNPSCGKIRDSGKTPQVFRIVSCANVIELKRVEIISQTLLRLRSAALSPDLSGKSAASALIRTAREKGYERIEWTHLGDGPLLQQIRSQWDQSAASAEGKPEEADRLSASRSGFTVSASFPGRLSHETVLDFYREQQPDLFIQTSRSEGVPVAIMEAFSFGIPVIATNAGGTSELFGYTSRPEIIRPEESPSGTLLPLGTNPDMLTESLLRYLTLSEEQKEEMRRQIGRHWHEHWNARNNYERFSLLLRKIADQDSSGSRTDPEGVSSTSE